jgi:hypothetical protein
MGSGVVVGGSWVGAGSQAAVTSVNNTAAKKIVLAWFFMEMDPPGLVGVDDQQSDYTVGWLRTSIIVSHAETNQEHRSN